MPIFELSRRETLTALAASAAAPLLAKADPAWARPASDTEASALLNSVADHLLSFSPETATSLGIDTGARASMRYHLGDRSLAGQRKFAANI